MKSVDFDYSYTYASVQANDKISIYEFTSFLTNEIKDVLRMADYYHSYMMYPKETFFVKNFLLFYQPNYYNKRPHHLHEINMKLYDPLEPIWEKVAKYFFFYKKLGQILMISILKNWISKRSFYWMNWLTVKD